MDSPFSSEFPCPDRFAYQLKSYAFDKGLQPGDKVFGIDRRRAWQTITKAGKDAHINKRIYPHLLRHSDAIERLQHTATRKPCNFTWAIVP
jgi:site-specific recombinase XerD